MKKSLFLFLLLLVVLALAAQKVADRPLKGDWDLNAQKLWSVSEVDGQALGKPRSVLILGNGKIAVYDPRLSKCFLLDGDGKYLTSFANEGEGPKEVKSQSFWFNCAGSLIIPDRGFVHFFDEQGKWLESKKVKPMPPPRGFIDAQHMVMVPRSVFEVSGEKGFFSILDLGTGQRQDLFSVSDLFAGGFSRQGEDVVDIMVPGLSPMIEVGIGPDIIVYGHSQSYELNVIDHQGRHLRKFGLDREKKSISHARIAEHLRSVDLPAEKAMIMAKTFPEEMVHFETIAIHGEQIWVQQARIDSRSESLVYDIFSHMGQYLYRAAVHLPEGEFLKSPFGNHFIAGDLLAAVVEDDRGELTVSCYRISLPR